MASLVNSLTPVAITVVAAIFLKEKITPVKILCLVLALAGTYVITSGVESGGAMLGIAVVLFSLISWSFASVFMRRLTAKYPAILVTALGMAVALCFHIPTMLVNVFALDAQVHFTPKVILVLLYLGLVGSGLAQATWTASLSYLPASTCSLFYPLQPMFSAILGAAILGGTFAPTFFIGMFLISLDVILSTLETRRLSRLEAEQEVKK